MTEKTTTTTSKMARIGCSQKKKKPIAQTQRNKKFYVSVILEALTEALTDLGACRPWVRNKGDQPLSLVFAPFPLQAHFAWLVHSPLQPPSSGKRSQLPYNNPGFCPMCHLLRVSPPRFFVAITVSHTVTQSASQFLRLTVDSTVIHKLLNIIVSNLCHQGPLIRSNKAHNISNATTWN